MAEVYLARTSVAQGLHKILVIKKIHSAYARSRQFVTMFIDEAKIALGLNHPNIIQVFDFGAVGDTYFLAMEFVEGFDLLRLLQECAKAKMRIPYGISAHVVQQVAKGLDYAHRKGDEFGEPLGIVHRDISPQNVLLSWDGSVKIVDFGIARARDVHEEQGVIKGKFSYMSPEQARGEPVDCRSDVFAAGIVLFEMVCARPLFSGKGKEALEMVKSGAIPRPRDFAPELPSTLENIILKALAFHRDDRFGTARDLQHELGRFALEWAQSKQQFVDSGSVAQLVSQVMPNEKRSASARPPAEPSERNLDHSAPVASKSRAGGRAGIMAPASRVTAARVADLASPNQEISSIPGALGAVGDDLFKTPGPISPQQAALYAAHQVGPAEASNSVIKSEAEPKERKYVYVLQGVLRGVSALERRVGSASAAALVAQFFNVARNIAYKHDAVIDRPRDGSPASTARNNALSEGNTEAGQSGDARGRSPADSAAAVRDSAVIVDPVAAAGGSVADANILRIVIGLPLASEDDATRAISLALALVDALDGIGSDVEPELRLAVAIQRGTALVAKNRSGRRMSDGFEIEETTAAFAHKLASQARGAEILVGGRVFRAARADWIFESLPVIDMPSEETANASRVDEDTDPGVKRARVYRLRGPKERAQRLRDRHRSVQVHGRDLELKAIRDAYRATLVSRDKRQLLVVGDAGVGKRTLLRQFLDGIAPGEALVVRASIRVGTAMTPYGVIADLARDVLGLAEDAEPHEVERRILRTLPSIYAGEENSADAKAALQIFSLLLGATGSAAAAGAKMDGDARRAALLATLHRIEQKLLTEIPLIVIGEDIHWADSDSQAIFAGMLTLPSNRPLLSLLTSRPDARVSRLAKELGSEVIHLGELSDASRRQMIVERFVPDEDVEDLIAQILQRAGGNPFFINEILDALVERGIVVPTEHMSPGTTDAPLLRWERRDAAFLMPSTIEDLLITRIDHLPSNEKDAIIYAAVLGRHVSAAHLSALLGRPARLELDELVRRDLLAPEDGEYRFKNDMTMSVAYSLLPIESRVALHRQVATRISGATGYRVGQDDALIARHLELAGDHYAAAERYLRAADHAAALGGNADGFRQLTRALKLLPTHDYQRRYVAHKQREEILRRMGKRSQQLRELNSLRKVAELLGDQARLATANIALAQFYIDVGKAPAAARAIGPALNHARESNDKLIIAEALRVRSEIARLVGSADESLQLITEALELVAIVERSRSTSGAAQRGSAPLGPDLAVLETRATILNNRGSTLWNIGRLEQAIESYAEALVIYRGLAMPRHEARALNNMGIVFAALGEYEEALAHYKSAIKIDQGLGDRSALAFKLGNVGQCYADLGDLDRADRYLAQAAALAEQTGDLSSAADVAVSRGQTKLQRRDLEGAITLLERGLHLAIENRARYQEIRALEYLALAQIECDRSEVALELAVSATELAKKMPMIVGVIYGQMFTALALSGLGRNTEAIAAAAAAMQTAQQAARPEGNENLLRWQARVLQAAGLTAQAAQCHTLAQQEIARKAELISDLTLRQHFVASRETSV
ncbi:MAG: protein kinase [Kofleriaceae bacterium]|nr:protein kinase [Kofleriaceae bacterium]